MLYAKPHSTISTTGSLTRDTLDAPLLRTALEGTLTRPALTADFRYAATSFHLIEDANDPHSIWLLGSSHESGLPPINRYK